MPYVITYSVYSTQSVNVCVWAINRQTVNVMRLLDVAILFVLLVRLGTFVTSNVVGTVHL